MFGALVGRQPISGPFAVTHAETQKARTTFKDRRTSRALQKELRETFSAGRSIDRISVLRELPRQRSFTAATLCDISNDPRQE
jgi:hypothetical protein